MTDEMVSVYFYKEPFYGVGISARKRIGTLEKGGKKDKIKQDKRFIVNKLRSTSEEQRPLPGVDALYFFDTTVTVLIFPVEKAASLPLYGVKHICYN